MNTTEKFQPGDRLSIRFETDIASIPEVPAVVVRAEPATQPDRNLLGIKFLRPNAPLMDIVKLDKQLHEGLGEPLV